MAGKTRYADHVKEWEGLAASLSANAAEVPQLEAPRAALVALLEEFRALTLEQAAFQAQKQQRSQRLQILMDEGRKIASMMRAVLKQHYGNRNEELLKFGIQPFRGVVRKKRPATEPPKLADTDSNPPSSSAE